MKLMVINGPNLNMLGIREPNHYGTVRYTDLVDRIQAYGAEKEIEILCLQSNHEGDLVDFIQKAYFEGYQGIVINPGAYTHTSVALLDAVRATSLPTIEVHISKVEERESFRQVSYVRAACVETISGKGVDGYFLALDALLTYLNGDHKNEG